MSEPDIIALETACLTAWPSIKAVHDRHWLWRWADGYSKRGNALQCHDPSDDADLQARVDRFMALSRQHGVPPLVRLTPLAPQALVAKIETEAWTTIEPSRVLAMALPAAAPLSLGGDVDVRPAADPVWADEHARLNGYDALTRARLGRILDLIAVPTGAILIRDGDGRVVATALVVQTGSIAVFLNVIVDANRRGQGLGRRVMTAGLAWASSAGATHAGIQVLADNTAALNLYRSLGFADRYGYSYHQAP